MNGGALLHTVNPLSSSCCLSPLVHPHLLTLIAPYHYEVSAPSLHTAACQVASIFPPLQFFHSVLHDGLGRIFIWFNSDPKEEYKLMDCFNILLWYFRKNRSYNIKKLKWNLTWWVELYTWCSWLVYCTLLKCKFLSSIHQRLTSHNSFPFFQVICLY